MGTINRDESIQILREDNRNIGLDQIILYVDQFLDYVHAAANIREHGTIVIHPRTGAPMENPYVRVRATTMSAMQKLKRLRNTGRLWALLEDQNGR